MRSMSAHTHIPVTSNMPYTSISVPDRRPHSTRNMTGIYLGLEGNIKPPKERLFGIPPLARGRGMPSQRISTPTEEKRKKLIELLRLKEENKGFVGNPLKKRLNNNSNNNREVTTCHSASSKLGGRKQWGPGQKLNAKESHDKIRTSARNLTTVLNNGFNRLEDLQGAASYICTGDLMAEELQRLSDSREMGEGRLVREDTDYTGFTIRSYRRPKQAAILASFPDPTRSNRPVTVPVQRLHVPEPYSFPTFHQNTAIRSKTCDISDYHQGPIHYFNGRPKSQGALSMRTIPLTTKHAGRAHSEYQLTDTLPMNQENSVMDKFPQSNETEKFDDRAKSPSRPLTSSPTNACNERSPSSINSVCSTPRGMDKLTDMTNNNENSAPRGMDKLTDMTNNNDNSAIPIAIGVEDEDGIRLEVDIDVPKEETEKIAMNDVEGNEENIPMPKLERRKSIQEKLEQRQEYEASVEPLTETAKKRQDEFKQLLTEHAEIVHEVKRSASAESLTSRNTDS